MLELWVGVGVGLILRMQQKLPNKFSCTSVIVVFEENFMFVKYLFS
jgi:hypothetical protein